MGHLVIRKRWLNRVAVVPPDEAASNITPTASRGSRSKAVTSPKASKGRIKICRTSATATAFGSRATRRKSATVNVNPRPNMMIASAIGRPVVINGELFM